MADAAGSPSGAMFDHADLTGAQFVATTMRDTRFDQVDMRGVLMRGVVIRNAELMDVDISGELLRVTINGVDVAPLIEAELDRREPERAMMRPTDPAGFRAAWDIVERRWQDTVERARTLPPSMLHESVDGEWSFIETLRHLLFATDAWIGRVLLGDPSPWDPLDLPFDQMRDRPGIPRDRAVRPSLDDVLTLRRDRMATMRRLLDELTDEQLAGSTTPVAEPGWPASESYAVRECLLCILNEEWYHRDFAERDLDVLVGRGVPPGAG